VTLVGIDEDTALVRSAADGQPLGWRVMGRQTVSIVSGDGERAIYRAGDRVPIL
jgi:hypothetical protein